MASGDKEISRVGVSSALNVNVALLQLQKLGKIVANVVHHNASQYVQNRVGLQIRAKKCVSS